MISKKRIQYNKYKPRRFKGLNVNTRFVDGQVATGDIIELQDMCMVIKTTDNTKMIMNKTAMQFITQRTVKKKKNMEQEKTFTIRQRSN